MQEVTDVHEMQNLVFLKFILNYFCSL